MTGDHANPTTSRKIMMKNRFLLIFLLVTALTASAQTKTVSHKELTLEDLNFGGNNYSNMTPENRWTTWWGDQLIRQELVIPSIKLQEKSMFSLL